MARSGLTIEWEKYQYLLRGQRPPAIYTRPCVRERENVSKQIESDGSSGVLTHKYRCQKEHFFLDIFFQMV